MFNNLISIVAVGFLVLFAAYAIWCLAYLVIYHLKGWDALEERLKRFVRLNAE